METGAGDHHHQQHFLKSSNKDDDDDDYSLETRDGKRVVGEMDLFPNGNLVKENFLVQVKKEITSEQGLLKVKPDNHDLDIGLNLAGNNSHISVVEDERSRRTEQDQKQRKNMLADLKTELNRMNIENQRLRSMLNQVNSNYHALQMHLASFVDQQQRDQSKAMTIKHDQQNINGKPEEKQGGALVARQFMEIEDHSLSTNYEERSQDSSMMSPSNIVESLYNKSPKRGNSDIGNRGTWAPNKVLKLHTSADVDEERAETTSITRKARVSVRTRFEASTISDGCQWRKYGQKFAKGNPCPRSYYRCSMGSCCPVRKQVQKSVEDHTILITTYEGHHNHPLPPAAVAMVSATSAASSMLLSGSTSSPVGITDHDANSSSSLATISSTSPPFPTTITLDLTRNNPVSGIPSQRPQGLNPLSNILPDQERYFHVLASKLLDQVATNNRQIALSPDNAAEVAAAITAEPNFTAALVAAITSIMGSALT